uniref:Uncharacterized protein n=2 Tax=Ixodes ricinus TaxID=34613 RepID=A0A147BI26_IXORI
MDQRRSFCIVLGITWPFRVSKGRTISQGWKLVTLRFFSPSRCDLWCVFREGCCWFLLMRKTGGVLLVCVCSPSHWRRCEGCRACLWWGEREVCFVFVLQEGTENLSQAPRMRTHGEDGDILNEFKMLSFSYPTFLFHV